MGIKRRRNRAGPSELFVEEEGEAVEDGTGEGGGDGEAEGGGMDGGGEEDALVADGGALGQGVPTTLRVLVFHGEGGDALTQGDVFLQEDAVEGHRPREGEGHDGREDAVVDSPVGVVGGVEDIEN